MINLLVGGVAGAVLLAFVGAPQSLEMMALVGPDSPGAIDAQLTTALAGAAATAAAVLLARHWRWLVAGGALAVLVGVVIHDPAPALLTIEVAPGRPDLPPDPAVTAFVMAAAGVLLIGLLGLTQELLRVSRLGAALAGTVGVAGYFGVALIGPLAVATAPIRIAVAAVAAVLTVLAALRALPEPPNTNRDAALASGPDIALGTARDGALDTAPDTAVDTEADNASAVALGAPGSAPDAALGTSPATAFGETAPGIVPATQDRPGNQRLFAAAAVLLCVLPTLLVAITGEVVFGTLAGGLAGLVVLAGALAAAAPAGRHATLALAATGAVLAAPVVLLIVIRDGIAGSVWYGWPLALAATLVGAALAARVAAPAPALAAAVAVVVLVVQDRPGDAIGWVYVLLVLAAAAATIGTAAQRFGDLPAFGALATAAAVGVHASLHLTRIGADGRADPAKILGPTGQIVAAVALVLAAVVLALSRTARRR